MKSKDWIIPILFMASPFMILAPGLMWKGQQLFFITMGLIIVAFQIKNLLVRAFLLYAMLWQTCIFLAAFNQGINPGPGLSIILSLLAGAIVFLFVSEGSVSKQAWYSVIRVAVIVQMIFGLLQYAGYNPVVILLSHFTVVRSDLPHIVGTLGNRNFLAAFIAISISMFACWERARIRGFNVVLPILFAFLVLCPSPGSLAGIIGIAVYYAYSRKLKHAGLYLLLSVIAAVGFAATYILVTGNHISEFKLFGQQWNELREYGDIRTETYYGDVGRFGMWMTAAYKLTQNWFAFVFGFGPGAYWGRTYPLHSEYVSMWFQFGLAGIALMLAYIFTTARRLYKSGDAVLLTAFGIICLDMVGNFPVEVSTTAFLIIVVCGLIERDRLEERSMQCLSESDEQ